MSGKKLLLKPASFQSLKNENGNSVENGSASNPFINNPFLKISEKEEPEATKSEDKNKEDEKDPAREVASNLFKPANTNLFAKTASLSENSNFVFGQNLHERVVMENVNTTPAEPNDHSTNKKDDTHLFSNALSSSKSSDKDNSNHTPTEGLSQPLDQTDVKEKEGTETISSDSSISLVEAARKYEEMRGAKKRKYEEVETTTGEENERNILEINCKLFTFIENNYEERGRGILRLNDSKTNSSSRVVFRTHGSFRLLLNTKVWRDQICEQPSQKSLRLTAFDTNGLIKIFLVMGRVEDICLLSRALSLRIKKEKDRIPEPEEAAGEPAADPDEPAHKKPVVSSE